MQAHVQNILIVAFNKSIASEVDLRIRNPRALKPMTDYQRAICQAVMKRDRHIVVNALAGSGKTTQLEQICACFPDARKRVSTLHSAGYSALRYHVQKFGMSKKEPEINGDKIPILIKQAQNYESLNADDQGRADAIGFVARRLIDLSRAHGYSSFLPYPENSNLTDLINKYGIDLPEPETGITDTEIFDLVRKVLNTSNNDVSVIDFEDMIHMPIVLKVTFPWNELILVDEAQDMNASQIELIRRMANGRSGVVWVGDRWQSIYGFRGADINAIESIVEIFDAVELPLSTCWRCPTAVIEEAQKIVPEIEAAPTAIQGKVGKLSTEKMTKLAEPGNFILCRTTAPLVAVCMQLIRAGKPATVRGRDIGQGLDLLAAKIARKRSYKGKSLMESLQAYSDDQASKLSDPRKETQLQSLLDKMSTLMALAEECNDFSGLRAKIKSIFSDIEPGDDNGLILCSTAHKAKGLESRRVFIIRPELMPFPFARQDWQIKQEMNLKYVAITRSTDELYFVPTKSVREEPEAEVSEDEDQVISAKPKRRRAVAAK